MSEQRKELIKLFGCLHNAVKENPADPLKVSGCLLDITAKFDYDEKKIKELEEKLAESIKKEELAAAIFTAGCHVGVGLEKKLAEAIKLIEMVQDNSKMPHQHSDYYLRLCCLSERAAEFLSKDFK